MSIQIQQTAQSKSDLSKDKLKLEQVVREQKEKISELTDGFAKMERRTLALQNEKEYSDM